MSRRSTRRWRRWLPVAMVFAPTPLKRAAYRAAGWHVSDSARIGFSFFLGIGEVVIGPNVRVGHFNVFRNLQRVELQEGSEVGQWNWFTASPEFAVAGAAEVTGTLAMARESVVVSRHYLDCSGGLQIGELAVIAGVRTTILTHQIDVVRSRQGTDRVIIGDRVFIGTNAVILPGVVIAPRCQIGAGALVANSLEESDMIYAGVPAKPVRKIVDAAAFHRRTGRIGL